MTHPFFFKDKNSAKNLLVKIEQFSKISGLEVNRTKSECLLLSFEVELGEGAQFLGIPVVENLKILGHFYGKNELICNYQEVGKNEKGSEYLETKESDVVWKINFD